MSQAHPNNRSQWLEPPDDADPVHEWGHLRCPDCGDMTLAYIDNLLAVAVRLAYDAQKEGTP